MDKGTDYNDPFYTDAVLKQLRGERGNLNLALHGMRESQKAIQDLESSAHTPGFYERMIAELSHNIQILENRLSLVERRITAREQIVNSR